MLEFLSYSSRSEGGVMQGVTPKAGVHDEQKEKNQVKPSNVINSALMRHIVRAVALF